MKEERPEHHGVRVYVVTVDGHESMVSARSRSAARFDRFRDWSDVRPDATFMDFLRGDVSVRLSPTPPPGYDYVKERYGLDVKVGDVVFYGNEWGTVAAPEHDRVSLVQVFLGGHPHSSPFHPGELSKEMR